MFGSLRKRGGTIVLAAVVGAVAAGSPAVAAEVVASPSRPVTRKPSTRLGRRRRLGPACSCRSMRKGKFPGRSDSGEPSIGRQAGPAGPQGARARRARPEHGRPKGTRAPQVPPEPQGRKGSQGLRGSRGSRALTAVSSIPRSSTSTRYRRRLPRTTGTTFIVNGQSLNNALSLVAHHRRCHELRRMAAAARGRDLGDGGHARQGGRRRHHDLLARRSGHRRIVDAYGAAVEQNVRATIAGITVDSSGMHTLRVRTDAKNIASSNYFGYLVWLRLVKQ